MNRTEEPPYLPPKEKLTEIVTEALKQKSKIYEKLAEYEKKERKFTLNEKQKYFSTINWDSGF